jgi:hypothetical protein
MGINFWGVVHGTRAFLPYLRASGDVHVINTSSLFGIIAMPTQGAYNASKFAVRGYTEALRMELEMEGAHRRRRPVGHRRGRAPAERLPGPPLRDPREPRRDRRHVGPVPLSRRALRLRHVHARLQRSSRGRTKSLADGPTIRDYIVDTAVEHGIDKTRSASATR